MAGITQPLLDIMKRLGSLQVINSELKEVGLYVRIWNNQVQDEVDGKIDPYPKPAAFLEVSKTTWQQLGAGVKAADLVLKIHIIHTFIDAGDGTLDQDLAIFDLRNRIDSVNCLSLYTPTACSCLMKTGEEQDLNHANTIYHFVSEYTCHFIDNTGSPYNQCAYRFTQSTPPTALETDISTQGNGGGGGNFRFFEEQFEIQFE